MTRSWRRQTNLESAKRTRNLARTTTEIGAKSKAKTAAIALEEMMKTAAEGIAGPILPGRDLENDPESGLTEGKGAVPGFDVTGADPECDMNAETSGAMTAVMIGAMTGVSEAGPELEMLSGRGVDRGPEQIEESAVDPESKQQSVRRAAHARGQTGEREASPELEWIEGIERGRLVAQTGVSEVDQGFARLSESAADLPVDPSAATLIGGIVARPPLDASGAAAEKRETRIEMRGGNETARADPDPGRGPAHRRHGHPLTSTRMRRRRGSRRR
jgi:hypothetical protein